jgi:Fe-S cluster biogenesis protein NfuA
MLSPTEREEVLVRIGRVLDAAARSDAVAVELVGIDDDRIVQIRLPGTCPGCDPASHAITMAIEAAVKAEVPEVRFIEAVP